MTSPKTLAAVIATAEFKNKKLSSNDLDIYAEQLSAYTEDQVVEGLKRVQRECEFFSLNSLVERISDGRPGNQEAWSLVALDEADTTVITEEIAEAMKLSFDVISDGGSKVDARMAFLEVYPNIVARARASQQPTKWFISLGDNKNKREGPIREAALKGRISHKRAQEHVPQLTDGVFALALAAAAADDEMPALEDIKKLSHSD